MNYLTTEQLQKALKKIEAVEKKLDNFIAENKQQHNILFNDLAQRLGEQREEIVRLRQELENERKAREERRAKAIQQFKSE